MIQHDQEIWTANDRRILFAVPFSGIIHFPDAVDGSFLYEAWSRCLSKFSFLQSFLPSLNPANWFKTYQEVISRFSVGTYLLNSIFMV